MSLNDFIELAKTIVLGKGGPDSAGDPLVLGLWVIASGFFALAVKFAGREGKGGAVVGCALLGTIMASGLVAKGYADMGKVKQAGTETASGKGAAGGGVQPGATVTFATLRDTSLGGKVLVSRPGIATATACEQECRASADCIAYTHDQPTASCQLKREVGSKLDFKGSTSGIKERRP
jgi:hypothetical protein